MLAALRGDGDAATSRALRSDGQQALGHAGYGLAAVQAALGLSALGVGHYEAAYEHLRQIFTPGDLACHYVQRWWTIADLAAAAASVTIA